MVGVLIRVALLAAGLVACNELKVAPDVPHDAPTVPEGELDEPAPEKDDDAGSPRSDAGESKSNAEGACPLTSDFPSPLLYVTNEETALDTVTHLEWERASGKSHVGFKTFADAERFCGELRTRNHDDWRLPTRSELFSIVDYTGKYKISSRIFPEFSIFPAWSSSAYGPGTNEKWFVDFVDGITERWSDLINPGKTEPEIDLSVRCVRSAGATCTPRAKRFVESASMVRDEMTGLEWEGGSAGSPRGPAEAVSYCSNLRGADPKRPWRVPAAKEMESLVVSDAANGFVHPLFASEWKYWRTSTQAKTTGFDVRYHFDLTGGRIVMDLFNLDAPRAIRCVR